MYSEQCRRVETELKDIMQATGQANAQCKSSRIDGRGQIEIVATFRHDMTHSAFNRLVDKQVAIDDEFLVVSWHLSEPIIHGFGETPVAAWMMAQACTDNAETYKGEPFEMATREPGERLVWRCKSQRIVTVEHMRSIDN
jgi:hypothetical protein